MVNMTVYADGEVFCFIVNALNHGPFEGAEIQEVSLKKTKRFKYEIQVPIVIIGQFSRKNKTTIDLEMLVQLNEH